MQKKIRAIIDERSDINPYGATNEAEFLAVASEYFFERPKLLKEKHPDLI
jgi:Mlc titration factor MtfA (ptsG expression regulator)